MKEFNLRSRTSKHRKPFYKKWWFWPIIVIFIIGGIGNIIDSTNDSKLSSTQETQVKEIKKNKSSSKKKNVIQKVTPVEKESATQNKKDTVKNKKKIAKTSWDFNTVSLGMTKKQVKSILGEPTEITFTGKYKYGNDTLIFNDNKLYDGTPENIKQAAINRDKPQELKADAKVFGTDDAETVQKNFASQYINNVGMGYGWKTDYGTLIRIDNTSTRITTVYLLNDDGSLGQTLYQGQTILQKAPKQYYYNN